ncbi:DNA-3-methyladenine glycosylase family protein [Lacicoccus alkaliphilus]|uniref:DNA-3-methyladenine glycosylase II n=1 Tax=Lacicoccus alkaliphilus DSM 16010 TaxID=1123231 RepID=A0A1M7J667_9BACL|nr:DNA-3-methyladenine glycosylase [Salinicoccus alkaliphilus]SHM48475.1 DNA-3-methyladenine glycosylase II [Salinicoccus alkaliphilus DSM 16010]
MEIKARGPYSFEETLRYMKRQDDCLYTVKNDAVYKAERFGGRKVLMKLTAGEKNGVRVEVLLNEGAALEEIREYCIEWLDLDYNLEAFYAFARKDARLRRVVEKRHGYRMVGKVDIVDAFLWAILGQQINMAFAYVLKRRIIEHHDHHVEYEGGKYPLLPSAAEIAAMRGEVLRGMQISGRKTEYIHSVMHSVDAGELSKSHLRTFDEYDGMLKYMTGYRGIGPWSANTVLMRTLKCRNAVPVGDAGIKNALRHVDGMDAAPSRAYIDKVTGAWGDFGMYGTLYMWEML